MEQETEMEMRPEITVTWSVCGKFRDAMRAHGLRGIAALCNVSPQTACNWASGAPMPDWAMGTICNAIGWSRPLLRYQALAAPDGVPPGSTGARIDWTGGIVKKRPGRPRKSPPVVDTEPTAEPVSA